MALSARVADSSMAAAPFGSPLQHRHHARAFTSALSQRRGRSWTVKVRADNALIINTKGKTYPDLLATSQSRRACSTNTALARAGGGHAFIGLYLAKQLLSDGHSVTILNDGAKVSA